MKNSIISSEKDALLQVLSAGTIGIVIGKQNTDTCAAALALYLSLTKSGKEAQIVSKKDITVELSSLFGVNKIEKSFSGRTTTLTISVPYREGEIEKVSYNIEADKLNVNLFAEENGISFREQDIQYIRKGSSPEIIFAVGVANLSELDGVVDTQGGNVKIVNIDNSQQNSLFGDVLLVDSFFSSTSEIVCEMIIELGLVVDPDISQNLLDGIAFATRNFTSQQASAYAFESAGFLLMNGAQRKSQNQNQNQNQQPNRNFPNQRPQQAQPRNFPSEELLTSGSRNQNQSQNQNPIQSQNSQRKLEEIVSRIKQSQNQGNNSKQNISDNRLDKSFDPEELDADESLAVDDDFSQKQSADPAEVPDDWFLPKVFKGSKKRN